MAEPVLIRSSLKRGTSFDAIRFAWKMADKKQATNDLQIACRLTIVKHPVTRAMRFPKEVAREKAHSTDEYLASNGVNAMEIMTGSSNA